MPGLLEVDDLKVRYRVLSPLRARLQQREAYLHAVCGVSFSISAGESFALVGESGSGKSTLARTIVGIETAHAGSIRFDGQELCGLSKSAYKPYRRQLSMMFQDPAGSLSPRLTVKRSVTEPFKIHAIKDVDLDVQARRLLQMVGLSEEFLGRYPPVERRTGSQGRCRARAGAVPAAAHRR